MAIQFGTRFWPRMQDGLTRLGERYFNQIWELIDKRLADLENLKADWIKATEDLIAFGLQRIDAVLAPAFSRVGRIAELGFLRANSTTTETLVVDEVSTFVIDDPDQRELFHVSTFVAITRPDNQSDFAIGRVASYVRATGILDVEIKQIVGSAGPHSDWEIVTGSGVTIYVKAQADAVKAARDLARDWAEKAVDTDVSGAGTRSAKHHSAKSAGFAQEAKDARDATNAAAILIAGGPVSSVNGKTGAVTLAASDVGAVSVADGNAISNAVSALSAATANADNALDLAKAPKASPSFTGTVTLPNGQQVGSTSPVIGSIRRSARTVNAKLLATDTGTMIDITSGTFTQTFDPAATLGNGWWVRIRNAGTGDITLDPNGSEMIDGLTSFIMYPGEIRDVQCDGFGFYSTVINPFFRAFTASGTLTKPPGYRRFGGQAIGGGGGGGNFASGSSGGGGGGGCTPFDLAASALGATETVTIASGGAAQTSGGNTTLGALVTGYGGGSQATGFGGGGGGGVLGASTNATGGSPRTGATPQDFGGGDAATVPFPSVYGGGGGAQSAGNGAASIFGGGGGGSSNGTTAGTGGASGTAGAGGASVNSGTGNAGVAPGGGGGGGTTGGTGARGELRIWGTV